MHFLDISLKMAGSLLPAAAPRTEAPEQDINTDNLGPPLSSDNLNM